MKCKKCGTKEFGVSVFQNNFKDLSKKQYVYLCPKCWHELTGKPTKDAIYSI